MSTPVAERVAVTDLVAAVRRQRAPMPLPPASPSEPRIRTVNVAAAHPGAGATVVAIAMADALDELAIPVSVLDLATEPDSFGAAECEVDAPAPSWRAGWRGRTRMLRPIMGGTTAPDAATDMIVDGPTTLAGMSVVVCRATLPSVRRAEGVLPDGAVVAVVGAKRWPKTVLASVGPTIRHAVDEDRIVFVPYDRRLELFGVDAEPLPASVRGAGRQLVQLLWPDLDEIPPGKRARGVRR